MCAGGQFEVELHPRPSLEVACPDQSGLAWPNARDEKKEREVIRLPAEAHRWKVVDSVVKEMGPE